MKTNQIELNARIYSLEESIKDAMILLSEIDGMTSSGSQEQELSKTLARCAFARLQQLIRETKGE